MVGLAKMFSQASIILPRCNNLFVIPNTIEFNFYIELVSKLTMRGPKSDIIIALSCMTLTWYSMLSNLLASSEMSSSCLPSFSLSRTILSMMEGTSGVEATTTAVAVLSVEAAGRGAIQLEKCYLEIWGIWLECGLTSYFDQADRSVGWKLLGFAKWIANSTVLGVVSLPFRC